MSKTLLKCGAMLCVALLFSAHVLWPQDEDKEEGIKKYGVIHNIAEDRQVIRVGGSYEPEGLDKYIKRQIDGLLLKITDLDAKIAQIQPVLEQKQKKLLRFKKIFF